MTIEANGTLAVRNNPGTGYEQFAASNLTLHSGSIVLAGTGRIQGIDTVSATTDATNKTYVDTCLATKQASGTYNTIIGTDSDINTSGCQVVDQLNMTDGVIQSHSTRNITLANLGYTGATNATSCTGTVCNLANLGITSTAAEVNYTTDVTSNIQAQLNVKYIRLRC
jgi:hypothetical protein